YVAKNTNNFISRMSFFKGSCVSPNECECDSGWGDSDCSSYNCAAVSNCNDHGERRKLNNYHFVISIFFLTLRFQKVRALDQTNVIVTVAGETQTVPSSTALQFQTVLVMVSEQICNKLFF